MCECVTMLLIELKENLVNLMANSKKIRRDIVEKIII